MKNTPKKTLPIKIKSNPVLTHNQIYGIGIHGLQHSSLFNNLKGHIEENNLIHTFSNKLLLDNINLTEVKDIIKDIFKNKIIISENTFYIKEDKDLSVLSFNILGSNIIQLGIKSATSSYDTIIFNKIKKEFEKLNKIAKGVFTEISWCFTKKGDLTYFDVSELIADTFYEEAYPFIGDTKEYIKKYLIGKESILLMQGPAGTGKTRFIRKILKQFSTDFHKDANVLYVTSNNILDFEELYVRFVTNDYNFFVIEDIDQMLESRKHGNSNMSSLLTSSDGLINSSNKKIILTTNLPNVNNIDDALLRPGRCYDSINFRKLSVKEAHRLYEKIHPDDSFDPDNFSSKEISIAEVYNKKS